jgi:sodium transport system permease protein
MNALQRIWIIFSKEVTDNLRDRRSIFSALASSLIGPALILLLIVILGRSVFSDPFDNPLEVAVSGAENAPDLIQFLEQAGARINPAPEDPENAVRNGDVELVLIIPEGYARQFASGQPATIRVVLDTSRQSALATVERARSLIEGYSQQTAVMRLMARGIHPAVITPLAVEQIDVSTPESQSLIFLNMLPYFVIFGIFLGGMYVIIDTTAGERERGSLEPLLINPAARWEFVAGKLLASVPFAIATLIFTLLAFWAAFNLFPVEEYIGMQLSINGRALVNIFLLSLPMIVLASALQMIIATFTRSFKEAQTYTGFLPIIPALPGLALAFLPVRPALWMMLIPTFGQQILINQFMRSELVNPLYIALSSVTTLIVALVLILVAIRMYSQERILFSNS